MIGLFVSNQLEMVSGLCKCTLQKDGREVRLSSCSLGACLSFLNLPGAILIEQREVKGSCAPARIGRAHGAGACGIVDNRHGAVGHLIGTESGRKLRLGNLTLQATGELIIGGLVIPALERATVGVQGERRIGGSVLAVDLPGAIFIDEGVVTDECVAISKGIADRARAGRIVDTAHGTVRNLAQPSIGRVVRRKLRLRTKCALQATGELIIGHLVIPTLESLAVGGKGQSWGGVCITGLTPARAEPVPAPGAVAPGLQGWEWYMWVVLPLPAWQPTGSP
jgi:hypothetical protein